MRYIMFQPRFAHLVESGKKRQTIRPWRLRPIKVGEKISLREWTGAPYRSKQRMLREVTIKAVSDIVIDCSKWQIKTEQGIGEPPLIMTVDEANAFAVKDGFVASPEMFVWFMKNHGPGVFHGVLLQW